MEKRKVDLCNTYCSKNKNVLLDFKGQTLEIQLKKNKPEKVNIELFENYKILQPLFNFIILGANHLKIYLNFYCSNIYSLFFGEEYPYLRYFLTFNIKIKSDPLRPL